MGLFHVNRLDIGLMLPVLIKRIKNVLILVLSQLRVLYQDKYSSAGIRHMNKASRFNLKALSECKTVCH